MHPLYRQALDTFSVCLRPLPANPPVPRNVVYTVYLQHRQDLTRLPDVLLNVKRNSTHFSSCNIKIANPAGTVLLFESGKLVCVGAMTPCGAYHALMLTRLMLLRMGARCEFKNPTVNNIVMVNDLGHAINMAAFVAHNEELCHYVPKKFSGCTFSSDGTEGLGDPEALFVREMIDGLEGLDNPELLVPADDDTPARERGVIFEAGKYNVMGVTSYEDGFRLSEDIQQRAAKFRDTLRTNRVHVVKQRERELAEARMRYQRGERWQNKASVKLVSVQD